MGATLEKIYSRIGWSGVVTIPLKIWIAIMLSVCQLVTWIFRLLTHRLPELFAKNAFFGHLASSNTGSPRFTNFPSLCACSESIWQIWLAENPSCPQRSCPFWSASRIATSGQVQWDSGSDWLCKHNRMRPEPIRFVRLDSDYAQSDGKSVNRKLPVLEQVRGRDSWCWPKEARPPGKRMAANQSRSQNPRVFWSAPRHGALEWSISRLQDFRSSGVMAHAFLGLKHGNLVPRAHVSFGWQWAKDTWALRTRSGPTFRFFNFLVPLSFFSFSYLFAAVIDLQLGLRPVQKILRKHHRDGQFSLATYSRRKFCSEFFTQIFEHFRAYISGSIKPITLISVSLERSFPPAEVECRWCEFWPKIMTSEVEQRPRLNTAGYGRHGSQWVKPWKMLSDTKKIHSVHLREVFQSIGQNRKKSKNLDKFIFIQL